MGLQEHQLVYPDPQASVHFMKFGGFLQTFGFGTLSKLIAVS